MERDLRKDGKILTENVDSNEERKCLGIKIFGKR